MRRFDSANSRRAFLSSLGGAAAVVASGALARPALAMPDEHQDRTSSPGDWDMSWVDRVQQARYRAVFDSPSLADGAAPALAADILNGFKDAYGTIDNACMVVVMRQMGQVMAFNDLMWDRYSIGEERKVNDATTGQPAKRNPFASVAASDPDWAKDSRLETLRARGAIFLVCNRASMNWAESAAKRTNRDIDAVRADVRKNLVPGAYLMPTGIFALVRAQNAGCAYMRGS